MWLREGSWRPGELFVRGRLRVVEHPPSVGAGGTRFEGFTEILLADANPVAIVPVRERP